MTHLAHKRWLGFMMLGFGAVGSICAADADDRASLQAEVQFLRTRLAALEARVSERFPGPAEPSPLPARAVQPVAAVESSTRPTVRLYGYVKVDAFYESADLFTDAIPFWVNPALAGGLASGGELGFSAKESRLGIDLQGPLLGGGHLHGQLEFDFFGNTAVSSHHAYTPRTRQAWVEWHSADWSVRAGEMWETYLITFPQTVNFASYNFQGQLGLRRTQLRLERQWRPTVETAWNAQLAFAEPLGGIHGADLDGNGQDDGANAELPVIEAKLSRQHGKLKVGLSGFYGQERLTLPGAGSSTRFDSWAVMLGGEVPLTASLSARGVIWRGTNLDSAWGGIGQGINLGLERTIDGGGGWVQLAYAVSPQLFAQVGYSIDDPANDDLSAGQRSYNQTVLINGFYQFNETLNLGLEYLRLCTGMKGQSAATADRVQTSIKYKF
jgi:predicted porin